MISMLTARPPKCGRFSSAISDRAQTTIAIFSSTTCERTTASASWTWPVERGNLCAVAAVDDDLVSRPAALIGVRTCANV